MISVSYLCAQEIKIEAEQKSLSAILLELKSQHAIEVSFDDRLLKECVVTHKKTYSSLEKALKGLSKFCGLEFKQSGGVYVFLKEQKRSLLSAEIKDMETGEPLPFSSISYDGYGTITDLRGKFSLATKDSNVHIQASHLGYYVLDTIVAVDGVQELSLRPSVIGLDVIEVFSDNTHIANQSIINSAGHFKLNHQLSELIPGSNDKLMFNLLRLQPGVLAAGEQAEDFIVWGTYHGQTQILFDGMTLFNTVGLNNDIGSLNHMLIQDIEVYKGGYNVDIGDRAGALINIRSRTGDFESFQNHIQFNNQIVSGLSNVPISKNINLQIGARNTFYNSLNWEEITSLNEDKNLIYNKFTDLNLKLSSRLNNGDDFYLSILGGNENEYRNYILSSDSLGNVANNKISQKQRGATAFYGKHWHNGSITNFTLAASSLGSDFANSLTEKKSKGGDVLSDNMTTNYIEEESFKLSHILPLNDKHGLNMGMGLVRNSSLIEQDSLSDDVKDHTQELIRAYVYVKDQIRFGKRITLEPGLRLTSPLSGFSFALEERLRLGISLFKNLELNLAYGQYDQYISSFAAFDQFSNSFYYWNVIDNDKSKPLRSYHNVLSLAYSKEMLEWKIEAFNRTTSGIERLSVENNQMLFMYGDGRSQGLDIFVKKKFKRHYLSTSYTLSKSEESFGEDESGIYTYAPHDQRHEVKASLFLDLKPFYISANYVYGSGIPDMSDIMTPRQGYSRFDIAGMYKFKINKVSFETGASVLNLFNQQSLRYNPMFSFANYQNPTLNTQSITPMVFLNLGF